jgi:hypothetical protein
MKIEHYNVESIGISRAFVVAVVATGNDEGSRSRRLPSSVNI